MAHLLRCRAAFAARCVASFRGRGRRTRSSLEHGGPWLEPVRQRAHAPVSRIRRCGSERWTRHRRRRYPPRRKPVSRCL